MHLLDWFQSNLLLILMIYLLLMYIHRYLYLLDWFQSNSLVFCLFFNLVLTYVNMCFQSNKLGLYSTCYDIVFRTICNLFFCSNLYSSILLSPIHHHFVKIFNNYTFWFNSNLKQNTSHPVIPILFKPIRIQFKSNCKAWWN